MTRLPIVNFRVLNAVLLRLGFVATRQHGSHVFYRHLDGRTTTVPEHPGRDISRALLRAILRDIDLSPEEFARELAKH